MGKATAQAAALGHRLGRFTIVLAGRAGNKDITIWGACCRCRGDAEVFVKLTARPDTGRRSVTIHGPAVGESHGRRKPRPVGDVPPDDRVPAGG